MNIVKVTDAKTKVSYQYDADMRLQTVDDGLAFFVSQLAYIDATIYRKKYRKIVYQDFVPVNTSDPEWTDNYTYFSYDGVTVGKFLGANAKDLPESDITAAKSTAPIFYGGNSYSYSLDELRKSQQLRMPVDTLKGQLSFRGFQEHAQRVAFFGDADRGVTGLFNNANVTTDSSSTVDFGTATGQQMVSELDRALTTVWNQTKQTQLPDVLLLPAIIWQKIYEKRMDTGTDTTVLEFFRINNLYTQISGEPLKIMQNLELDTAGASSKPRVIGYEMDDEVLTMRMPIVWRPLAAQTVGLRVKVPAEYKFGGVEIRFPGALFYMDLPVPS